VVDACDGGVGPHHGGTHAAGADVDDEDPRAAHVDARLARRPTMALPATPQP
jgi:hypothetical protein